jgi:hypothetical protein
MFESLFLNGRLFVRSAPLRFMLCVILNRPCYYLCSLEQ